MVAHAFKPHLGGRGRQISEFEASMVYRVSSRTARATQRIPVSEKQKTKRMEKKKMQLCTYIATKIPSGVIESDVLC